MVGSAKRLRLGTRGSRLALVQSELVASRLRARGVQVEIKNIVADGDLRSPDTPIGEGIFVTALERALIAGDIDLAVHSAKDLPLEEEPRSVDDLAAGATVGTDSPRRAGFLRALRPDLNVIPLHGNVDTRLRRLDAGQADALILAAAGLDRLGLGGRIAARLDAASMPPAPAQGALAVQARRGDREVLELVGALDDPAIRLAVVAERALLKAMGGGCRAPVGALAVTVGGSLALLAGAVTHDGKSKHVLRMAHGVDEADSLARAVSAAAHELKSFVPLRARAVIDTRPELDPSEREAIEREGFRVLHVPAIAIGPVEKESELERIRARIGDYDWVVVTSQRGAAALLDGAQSPSKTVRWAAVGATTATALGERGVRVDCVPASSRGDAIPAAMAKLDSLRGRRVLLARADAASKVLPAKLVEMGAVVDDVIAYRTVSGPETSRRALLEAMKDGDAEAIMFASGSAVRGIVELAGANAGKARSIRVVTIGPKTSSVARELGFEVAAEARTQDPEGLRAALRLVFDEEVERWVESQLLQPA